ncbi:receptor-like protein 47 [Arachis hypogaea]|uniref:receptor-like protein 47 n=1 Tax=Arachis hypogaea TaxID=3818 RepID=UPI003B21B0E3
MLQNATSLSEIILDDTDMSSISLTPSHLSNWSFSLVTLSLSYTGIRGHLTSQILCLPNLYELNLHGNRNIQVHVPKLNCNTSLNFLDLSWCQFSGSQIPSSFSNLTNLTSLYLSGSESSGSITSWLSNLQHLTHLDLSDNRFNGQFPKVLGQFTKLQTLILADSRTNSSYNRFSNLVALQLLQSDLTNFSKISWKFPKLQILELSENKLEGKIPKWIHDSHSLGYLELSHNQLSSIGQFPWYQLVYLDLSFNLLTDDNISFLCNATSLQIINLSHNKFRGTIPQCVANLSFLIVLDLQTNKFHGTLPSNFSRNLNTLNLNGNQLEGHLPRSLSNCKDLMDLNLGDNQIEDTFPHWLQSLNLEILVLRSNKFYGTIVSFKTKDVFPSLIIFDISSNKFSGQLPKGFQAMKSVVGAEVQSSFYYIQSGYGYILGSIDLEYHDSVTATMKGLRTNLEKIPNVFVSIDLSNNRFEGEIPDDFGELHALISLNLSHNSLTGPVPHSLGNLANLESLDLSSNLLTGKIPDELTNLIFLEVLNLSSNHLEGSIPRGKQFDTFSNDSYEENMGLCGFPLSIECNNNVPQQQYPSSEAEDKFGFGWKPVAIGYACGMVFGIGLGCCVFSNGKPQWLVIIFGGKRIKRRSRGNRRARTT